MQDIASSRKWDGKRRAQRNWLRTKFRALAYRTESKMNAQYSRCFDSRRGLICRWRDRAASSGWRSRSTLVYQLGCSTGPMVSW